MRLKNIVTHSLIATMFLNLNAVTVVSAISGMNVLFSYAQAQESDTPRLDALKEKYDLDNVNRNHQTTGQTPESMTRQMNLPSRNLSGVLAEQINGAGTARQIDLTNQMMTTPVNEAASASQKQAQSIGKTHGSPLKENGGEQVKGNYAKQGTREFYRDENGQLRMRAKENVERVSGITGSDLYGVEANNPEHNFKANEKYGDETGLHTEGKTTYQSLKTGKSASARGFQAITNKAQQGINTNINENEGWLQPGFNSLLDAENSPGDFFTSCQNVTRDINGTVNAPGTDEYFCQDIEQANFDFCEVERDVKIPIYSNTPGLRSCGPGCYEFDMNVSARSSRWKCRRTESGHGTPAEFTFNLNLAEPIRIKSVQIIGDASDHFRYQLNGQSLWQSTGGNQNTTGDYLSGSCKRSGHNINAIVTSRANQIIGSLPSEGIVPLNFRADIRWRGGGGMSSVVRIELETTDGSSLDSEFKQYPEGCYDALSAEDKTQRPLLGVYNWQEVGVSQGTGAIGYTCERPAPQPICNAGEQLFGNVTQEKCLSAPVCSLLTLSECGQAGFVPGKFTHTPPSCTVGALSADGNKCNYEASDTNGTLSCPNGGQLSGSTCAVDSIKAANCGAGLSLSSLTVNGEQANYCTRTPTQRESTAWQCGGGNSFQGAYCQIDLEDYLDPDDKIYVTVDQQGYSLLPISVINEEGESELVEFTDSASCSIPSADTPLPEVTPPTSFCTFESYQTIQEGNKNYHPSALGLVPQWFDGDTGNKTWKVNLEGYKCDPTNGQVMSFIDPETGEEKNYTWEDIQQLPQQCQRYMDDPQCREVNRECTDGWLEEQTGRCMADTVTFRCDRGKEIDYSYSETTNTCSGILPCSGGDCFGTEQESNGRFVEAMVAGSILDNIQSDSSCTDPSDPSTCRIFEGAYKYCSWETTGLGTDCCEQPGGIDILAYVAFSRQMMKVGQMAGSGAFGTGVQGMYSTLSEPIASAGQAVSSWASSAYSSSMNSLFGAEEVIAEGTATAVNAAAGETATAAIQAALSQLQQQVYQFVYDMLPDQLANLIFTTTASGGAAGASQLAISEGITNFASNVMAVYAAYQMIKLALTLLTACDEVEMDMGVKLAQRSCFAVGERYCSKRYPLIGTCMQNRQDYCCYSSILSRIIMKESYSQLGINPLAGGRPTEAQAESGETNACLGLTQEQLSMVDFAAPSMQSALQEWVGLLLESGEILTESSEQILTGGASKEDVSCQAIMQPVINPLTGAPVVDENGETVWEDTGEEDCYQRASGGQIFNAEARKTSGQRTKDRLGTADERVQEAKDYMKDAANNLDCSIYPRPPVCNYGQE
jgi:hypothetical protein